MGGILIFSEDITQRKHAENELLKSEARLRSLNFELESRVVERTSALQMAVHALEAEIAGRRLLEREVLRISDYEQSRIGRDLHDGTCQNLASIAVLADVGLREMNREKQNAATSLKEISQIARQSIEEVRRLATGLFPVKIEQHGLEWALRELASDISARTNVDCSFTMPEPIAFADKNAAVQVYRIAQEAISNALRHGRAKNVSIELSKTDGNVRLVVQDDGIGLPEGEKEKGLGLHTMEYRARLLGGSFEVGPAAERGTVIFCSFPEKDLIHPQENSGS